MDSTIYTLYTLKPPGLVEPDLRGGYLPEDTATSTGAGNSWGIGEGKGGLSSPLWGIVAR